MTKRENFIYQILFIKTVAVIELKDVSKEYKKTRILNNVNLTIEEGDILGVIGKSGSGKSTLLNLLAGFIEPSTGEITFTSKSGNKILDLNDHLHLLKKEMGYTPQHNSFYPHLTVQENLEHFGLLYKMKPSTLKTNIDNLLHFTKLSKHRNKLAAHLSGGMQKRLDLSCSLVHKPKILILDEPTADLDPILQKEILHLLQEVNEQGVTVVIASHHLDHIEHLCNKVAIVHGQKVHSQGLLDDVRKPFVRDHFTITMKPGEKKEALINKLKVLPIKKIVDKGKKLVVYPENVPETMNQLLKIIKDENLQLHNMHVKKTSLDEVFENIVLSKD